MKCEKRNSQSGLAGPVRDALIGIKYVMLGQKGGMEAVSA